MNFAHFLNAESKKSLQDVDYKQIIKTPSKRAIFALKFSLVDSMALFEGLIFCSKNE